MPKAPVDKTNLPSRHVTEGPQRAPHRSYFYAMGLDEEAIAQPWVGVATCWNEAAPCNISLSRQAQAVKKGVKAAIYRSAPQRLVIAVLMKAEMPFAYHSSLITGGHKALRHKMLFGVNTDIVPG